MAFLAFFVLPLALLFDFDLLWIALDLMLNSWCFFAFSGVASNDDEAEREVDAAATWLEHVRCLLIGWNFFFINRSSELILKLSLCIALECFPPVTLFYFFNSTVFIDVFVLGVLLNEYKVTFIGSFYTAFFFESYERIALVFVSWSLTFVCRFVVVCFFAHFQF